MVSDRLKKLIFNKLNMDLCGVEIIPYKDGIWFIDRENKYWYFELRKSGLLYWRYSFFVDYFSFFCMDSKEFEPLIGQWVENVLNRKVSSTKPTRWRIKQKLEHILNCKVSLTHGQSGVCESWVEDVVNFKVSSTQEIVLNHLRTVEDILNYKVSSTSYIKGTNGTMVEEVLNSKIEI